MNALQSLHNGALTGKREQSIYTPQCIVDALLRLWPEGIACDPCWGPGSIVPARAKYGEAENGLAFTCWPLFTYANPRFDKLRPWIDLFRRSWESVLMTPVRSHRRWWRPLLLDQVCWLDPLCFIGYEQVFPAPLAIVYRGHRSLKFADAFEGLGDVL